MTSHSLVKKQLQCIPILPNISRRKGNQTMKLGLLIECNIKNIFLENHADNLMEKLFLDPFL